MKSFYKLVRIVDKQGFIFMVALIYNDGYEICYYDGEVQYILCEDIESIMNIGFCYIDKGKVGFDVVK